MIPFALALLGLGILAALHMARPRFRRQSLSSARFFRRLPPPRRRQRRLAPANPLRSPSFYPQGAVLALIAWALFPADGCHRDTGRQLGLWILVDTSASMSARHSAGTRIDAAHREARRILEHDAEKVESHCLRLSTFDLELRTPLPTVDDPATVARRLDGLEARALGTDLGLVQTALRQSPVDACPLTHAVVISDLPAPDWLNDAELALVPLWRDVGEPVDNIGLVGLRASRDPFASAVRRVSIEVATYGAAPRRASLEVRRPGGESERFELTGPGPWRRALETPEPGTYELRLEPGGAYTLDDRAIFEVPAATALRIDWRLPGPAPVAGLGWIRDAAEPELRVLPRADVGRLPIDDVKVLVVGDAYGRGEASTVGYFAGRVPLLAGLNLDVLERAGIRGVVAPPGFEPVLTGPAMDRDVWLAWRRKPRGVYLPGPPTGISEDDPLAHASAALWANALRWLLADTAPPPLYTLTTPARPEPGGNHLALHDGEGRTDLPPVSHGSLDDLRPVRGKKRRPLWPAALVLAAAAFAAEQWLLARGGERWR